MRVDSAWTRATASGVPTAVYLTVVNASTQPDRLLSASSSLGLAELHETVIRRGKPGRKLSSEGFALEPQRVLELHPGGKHVMLRDLREPLAEGTSIELVLSFERAGRVPVRVTVLDAAVGIEPRAAFRGTESVARRAGDQRDSGLR